MKLFFRVVAYSGLACFILAIYLASNWVGGLGTFGVCLFLVAFAEIIIRDIQVRK